VAERGVQQYPHSSLSGQSLPFEVGDPYGMFIDSIAVAASAGVAIPNDDDLTLVALCLATVRCIISWDGVAPVTTEQSFKTNQAIIPAGGVHKLLLPGLTIRNISADGTSTGKLYVQVYRAWKSGGVEALKTSF